ATIARNRRFTAFRVTAFPTALETINPARGSSPVTDRIFADTTTFRLPKREPERCVSENCVLVRIRWCFGSTKFVFLWPPAPTLESLGAHTCAALAATC